MPNLAYTGHPALTREVFIAETRAHREAGRLIKSTYQRGGGKRFKGCAVGCAIRTIRTRTKLRPDYDDHQVYADLVLGGAVEIAWLEDAIFEGLPDADALTWPERFASAIPQSADLSGVGAVFHARTLREVVLPTVDAGFPDVRAVVERVAAGWETRWVNDDPSAARAAALAARAAALVAGDAGLAALAAALAADDAALAARVAALAAHDAALAARVAYQQMAEILLAALASAPVPEIMP